MAPVSVREETIQTADGLGTGFNFFLLINTLYLMSFIVIYALVLFKENHKYSVMARVYFNFLNTLVGKGFFLFFVGLIILEKHFWYDWIIGFVSIGTGICNIVVGWD